VKSEMILDSKTDSIGLARIVKAEVRKATDTQVSRTIIFATVFLTLVMFIVSIIRFKDGAPWTSTFMAISSPISTLFAIVFILLVCDEWTRGTALFTYTFVPQRSKVILAKFLALIGFYLVIIPSLYLLSALAAIIASSIYSYSISWLVPLDSVLVLMLPILINLLFGFSMALFTQESTIALGLYFFVPPTTVVASQLPLIGNFSKWFSLEHSSSLFVAGATGVTIPQFISSIIFWIAIPCIVGIIRNSKRDFS
jgi:ABC-2 type transport system permease protein